MSFGPKNPEKVLIIGADELVLPLFKLRGLILQDTMVWEIQISNFSVFPRLAGRPELAQMHKCVDHITGQLVGAGPALFPLFFSQAFDS